MNAAQWIEDEAVKASCEVVSVSLHKRDDTAKVMVAATGRRGEMFGCVLITGAELRSLGDAAEQYVRERARDIAQRTLAQADLDPDVFPVSLGSTCPHHNGQRITSISFNEEWSFACPDGVHALPDKAAMWKRHVPGHRDQGYFNVCTKGGPFVGAQTIPAHTATQGSPRSTGE